MKKPKLVEDAHKSWTWFSMQAGALNLSFLSTWALLPAKFQDALPPQAVVGIAAVLIVLGMIGRLVSQEKKP